MKTRWYVLVGSLIILFVLVIANMAHADQLVSDDAVAHSPAWYNGASITHRIGLQSEMSTVDLGVAISIPAELGTPYQQSLNISVYSDSGYTSILLSTSTTAAIIADGAKRMITFYFGAMPAGYWQITVYSDGGNVYGSCAAGTNDGGTNLSCTPTTDGVAYYSGIGGTPPGPSDDTSRIISVTPAGGATTSPVALSMQYYSSATSSIPLDTVSLDLRSIEGGGVSTLELSSTAATGTITTWSASSSATLPDGLYTAFWSLSSSESILYHIATSTQFIVGTSTWQELISLASTTPSATCSIVDIGGCMQSVITWAVIPSTQSQQLLAQSGSALLHAPPLGYYYTYHDTIKIAFSTTTIDEVMATSTRAALISIIDPMRTGAIAVFWAGWLVAQYAFFMRFILPLV